MEQHVVPLSREMARNTVDPEDLQSVGWLALNQAAETGKYQAERGPFWRYARIFVVGAMRRELKKMAIRSDVVTLNEESEPLASPSNDEAKMQLRELIEARVPDVQDRLLIVGRLVREESVEALAERYGLTKEIAEKRLYAAKNQLLAHSYDDASELPSMHHRRDHLETDPV